MGEVKQTNFRINQDAADAFRKFCESNGMNQAQGFDHIMQVVEMDRAKQAVPGRLTEIESFEKSVKDIMAAYLLSLETNQKAEGRIREQFASNLDRKDKSIDELRQSVERLQAEKDAAEAKALDAVKAKEQAEKDAAAAEKVRAAAEKTSEDKQTIAETLAANLKAAEAKAEGYDKLREALLDVQKAKDALDQKIKDIRRDAEEAAKEAAREAERAKEQAVREVSEDFRKEISDLKDKLREEGRKAEVAQHDADTSRQEVLSLKSDLEKRTEELIQSKAEVSALTMRLADLESKPKSGSRRSTKAKKEGEGQE